MSSIHFFINGLADPCTSLQHHNFNLSLGTLVTSFDCHLLVNQPIDSIWITKAIVILASSKFDINDKTMIEDILYQFHILFQQLFLWSFQSFPTISLFGIDGKPNWSSNQFSFHQDCIRSLAAFSLLISYISLFHIYLPLSLHWSVFCIFLPLWHKFQRCRIFIMQNISFGSDVFSLCHHAFDLFGVSAPAIILCIILLIFQWFVPVDARQLPCCFILLELGALPPTCL